MTLLFCALKTPSADPSYPFPAIVFRSSCLALFQYYIIISIYALSKTFLSVIASIISFMFGLKGLNNTGKRILVLI